MSTMETKVLESLHLSSVKAGEAQELGREFTVRPVWLAVALLSAWAVG